jgi:hypothetical protein
MPPLKDLTESFPAKVAVISAAVAAVSGLVFPAILLPDNLPALGATGSLVILIVFLMVWAWERPLRRSRRSLFLVVGALCLGALWIVVRLNTEVVEDIDAIGDPPQPARYLVGAELTPTGKAWMDSLGGPSRSLFIKRIGPSNIGVAWGASYARSRLRYTAAYLIMAAGVVLMLAISEFTRPSRRNDG